MTITYHDGLTHTISAASDPIEIKSLQAQGYLMVPRGYNPGVPMTKVGDDFFLIAGGQITGIFVSNGTDRGCGYTSPPAVTISGGTGAGATATATISGGIV